MFIGRNIDSWIEDKSSVLCTKMINYYNYYHWNWRVDSIRHFQWVQSCYKDQSAIKSRIKDVIDLLNKNVSVEWY